MNIEACLFIFFLLSSFCSYLEILILPPRQQVSRQLLQPALSSRMPQRVPAISSWTELGTKASDTGPGIPYFHPQSLWMISDLCRFTQMHLTFSHLENIISDILEDKLSPPERPTVHKHDFPCIAREPVFPTVCTRRVFLHSTP